MRAQRSAGVAFIPSEPQPDAPKPLIAEELARFVGTVSADAIPMAGVPFHAVESYLRRMIAAGHKVAICEQAEDPAKAKGLITREVVRLFL